MIIKNRSPLTQDLGSRAQGPGYPGARGLGPGASGPGARGPARGWGGKLCGPGPLERASESPVKRVGENPMKTSVKKMVKKNEIKVK